MLRKIATDQEIAKINSAVLRYTKPTNMTTRQYPEDLHAKPCKVADVYDESTLNDIFIKGVDFTICHRVRKYWAMQPHVDLNNIAFKPQSLLAIQKNSAKPASFGNHAAQ